MNQLVVTWNSTGIAGVLEANFIEPTHNKQEFEKTPIFQKLETRLKEMTLEYWWVIYLENNGLDIASTS